MRYQNLLGHLSKAILVGGVFTLVPLINAPMIGGADRVSYDSANMCIPQPMPLAKPKPVAHRPFPKPIKVWEGISGWYGEPFDGQPTANGEIYNMYGATAAHLTLPMGSVVRVVNLRTHRSEIVRINDRGPYVDGRELDVSYEVARRLGFARCGLARVRMELLEVPKRPAGTPETD